MRRFVDSLYGRLALVLIVALAAGFGTMHALFRFHSNDNRLRNLAHTLAVQVQLVEEVLRSQPEFERKPISGIVLSAAPGRAGGGNDEQEEFISRLQASLAEELGRATEIRAGAGDSRGGWIHLSNAPQGERWLYFSMPGRRSRIELWTWGLWVSFFVVLVLGMALLWGVNKPLRRLEAAIDQVGRIDSPVADPSGPREIRNLAEQFNRMVSRLAQYDRDRAEMLAGVAHDLRAPMTRLRLQLELELEGNSRREAMLANLEGIDGIVNQFLSFARGIVPEPRQEWSLQELIQETTTPYLEQGVSISEPEQPEIELEVMPVLLRRALANLLENAVEYGKAPITVSCERGPDEAVIRVADQGPGIPVEKMDMAMQAFTRLDAARSGKGHCGLGLAIVAKTAKLHRGRLVLVPGHPSGLVAEIRLPLV